VPLLLLLGFGPTLRWKGDSVARVRAGLQWVLVVSICVGMVLPFIIDGVINIATGAGLSLALWVAITTLISLVKRVRSSAALPLAFTGMILAHLGVAMFVVGVTMVITYEQEKDLRMDPGSVYEMDGYEFRFIGTRKVQGPNFIADEGRIELSSGGKLITELNPQKRIYTDQKNPMTEASIDIGFLRDVYISLGEELDNGAWSMRIYLKPMIRWIWMGCLFMCFGGVLAVSDKRYRRTRIKAHASIPVQAVSQG